MNRSRRWVFWRGTVLEIVLTLASQVMFLAVHGVHTAADAVFFSLISCAGPLTTHTYIAVYGLARESTQLPG